MGKRGGKVPAVGAVGPQATPVAATGQLSEGKAEKSRQTCLHSQLQKTKFCLYHLKGACQFGANCSFAHSCSELKATPDLRKTRLCVDFFEGGGCNNPECSFAHSEDDLRSTDMFYKKTLCIWNEKGKCWNGDQCRFAHGLPELRANNGMAPSSQRPKEPGATRPLITGEGIGNRQVSNETTSTSCGDLSTLSSSDTSGSMAATKSRPGRRGRRGQQGPENQPSQARQGKEPEVASEDMPMKVLPNRSFMMQTPQQDYSRPAQGGASTQGETKYDPALQAELMRLRYSVSALAAKCNQLNDQMLSETLKAENSDRMLAKAIMTQRLMEQARHQSQHQQQQFAKAAFPLAASLGQWEV